MRINLNDELGLKTYALVEHKNTLIFSDFLSNGIFVYDLSEKKAELIKTFKTKLMWNNYWEAYTYKDEIWFIPFRLEERIAIYNITEKRISYMDIPPSIRKCEFRPFSECYIEDGNMYMVPSSYDSLLKVEIESRKIFKIDMGLNKFADDGFAISLGSSKVEKKIYLCPWNNSELLCFDMLTQTVETIYDKLKIKTYMHILSNDSILYLIPQRIKDGILQIDTDTREVKINKFTQIEKIEDVLYSTAFIVNSNIYMFSNNSELGVKIDINTMKKEIIYICYKNEQKITGWYRSRSTSFGEIVIPSELDSPMLLVNEEGIHQLSLRPEKDYFMKVLRSQMGLD